MKLAPFRGIGVDRRPTDSFNRREFQLILSTLINMSIFIDNSFLFVDKKISLYFFWQAGQIP
jgi:hypothetical protein